jgi:catecholate siderophore receptor
MEHKTRALARASGSLPECRACTSPHRRLRPVAFGLASLSLFGGEGGAWAQTLTADIKLPPVNVEAKKEQGFATEATEAATRTDTPLRDIPQTINIVPQSLIRSQGATTLTDALRNVPGISYAAAEGGTLANQLFYLRGFPINEDIFIDGVRDLGEYNRDLFATDSIEVLKGSSALMFGRGSTGGVINQVSKVANLTPRAEVDLTFGSFAQKRATADVNVRPDDTSAVRLIGLAENSGSYRYPQGVEKYGFAPSLLKELGHSTDLTLSWYYLKTRDVTDYGQPTLYSNALGFYGFPPVSPRNYYGYANHDFAHYETNIGTARLDHQFDDTLSVRQTLRWARYRRQSESTIPSLSPIDANGNRVTIDTPLSLLLVTRNHDTNRSRDNDDTALISQTEVVWTPRTGDVEHTMLAGLEIAREKLDRRNYQLDADPLAPGVQAPTSTTSYLSPDSYTALAYTKTANLASLAQGDTAALYVQDQLVLSEQWKALIGVRWERFKADARTEALTETPTAASVGPFDRTDRMLSGRAGLIWQPSRTQSYYVAWGNSYNPSGELGVYGGTANTSLSPSNQNLAPEKNDNVEVGAQWNVAPGLQLRAAIFRTEKTNGRLQDLDTGFTVLAGKRRVDGVEADLTGQITRDWDVYASVAVMDGKIVSGSPNVQGNVPLGVARVAASTWSVYRLGHGFEIGGGVRGQTGTWLTDTNVPGSRIPGYAILDATLAYVTGRCEVRLNLYNLTDRRYFIGGYQNAPNRVLPGVPFSGAVSVRYEF